MADHVAEQIVAAAKAALTGLATTGARVFDSRVYPVKETDCPCILIDQGEEQVGAGELYGFSRAVERTLQLHVIAKVEQNVDYRKTVNQIRKEVEIALAAAGGIGGAKWVQPSSTLLELSGEGEKPIASGTMTFDVFYITALSTPDVAL
jgi:hypothetical protein